MPKPLQEFERQVSSWPQITVHAHRFGGKEFRLGKAELGHLHTDGTLDIPFPRTVHDALLEEGLAQQHHWIPDSGWTTFLVRSQNDLAHALWLMRLSYLRYALRTASDPAQLLGQENITLALTPKFRSLLAKFAPLSATRPSPS